MFKYIAYYTATYKKTWEKHLKKSLEDLKLDYYVEELKDEKDWKHNTDIKPTFIKKCLQKFFGYDLIYLDVDATINCYPELFEKISPKYDIGLHYFDWMPHYGRAGQELLSGTIYLYNGIMTLKLVNKWIELTPKHTWEQKALKEAISSVSGISVYSLPREYCYIATTPSGESPAEPVNRPVITHFQASRELRKIVNK